MVTKPLLTAEQVAKILGVGVEEVYRLGRDGDLPRIVFSRRMVRFDPDDVQAYIDGRREHKAWTESQEIPY